MTDFSLQAAPLGAVAQALRTHGCVLLEAEALARGLALDLSELERWKSTWERLPRDPYLRDGGRYRARRHGCFVQNVAAENGALTLAPRRPHWQPTAYNALHGGLERWFEPIEAVISESRAWTQLLCGLGDRFAQRTKTKQWFIEAHQFRIDTAEGIGRPTPEGAHRDGVDYVAVILVRRRAIKGGETRVFEAAGNLGLRFTMLESWTALLLDDARVIHETTPIQPDGEHGERGARDTLVLTYRSQAFQSPT